MSDRSGESPEGQQRRKAKQVGPNESGSLASEVARLSSLVDELRGERDELREALQRCETRSEKNSGREQAVAEHDPLEGQLRDVQKFEGLGVLARTIAHDLNNQLTVILGNCSLVQSDLEPNSPFHKRLERVRAAAQQSARLAEQMLSYSSSPADEVKPLHLPHLLESMRELLETAVGGRCELSIEGPPQVPVFEANESQIQQLIFNLVTNAGEALADKSGHAWIRYGVEPATASKAVEAGDPAEADCLFLEIEDDGSGIAAKDLERIFERFVTSGPPGRGLGLAAVRGIVQSHGGRIRLDSTPGKGTTVRVSFPQASSGNARRG